MTALIGADLKFFSFTIFYFLTNQSGPSVRLRVNNGTIYWATNCSLSLLFLIANPFVVHLTYAILLFVVVFKAFLPPLSVFLSFFLFHVRVLPEIFYIFHLNIHSKIFLCRVLP